MQSNPLVQFLRSYGPSAASDLLYDEHVQTAVKRHGVAEIELPAPLIAKLGELYKGDCPTNVILTGTAGDGKTYHIRHIFLDYLKGNPNDWPGDNLVLQFALPGGQELRIIRDLSELPITIKISELNRITNCLLGLDDQTLYLIAANDGQLLELWRSALAQSSMENKSLRNVHEGLSRMLQKECIEDPEGQLRLKMYNLSRLAPPSTLDDAISQLLEHPMWNSGCQQCPLSETDYSCPIQINRKLLIGGTNDPLESSFRSRIREVLQLAAANDQHVPLRQVLTLIVNIVLGTSGDPDAPLLSCETARNCANADEYDKTNPYNNVVGLNLAEDIRNRYAVFSTFESFGIGCETTNEFDDLLLFRRPGDVADGLEESDPTYGEALFFGYRRQYVKGPREPKNPRIFADALESQRRRLFFQLSTSIKNFGSPWLLTVFHKGNIFLEWREHLFQKHRHPLLNTVSRQLVKGFNRALTGMMTEEADILWLSSTVGKVDSTPGRLALSPGISRRRTSAGLYLAIKYDATKGCPNISVEYALGRGRSENLGALDIRPQTLEYLWRVAEGSLPSSFSPQCHQEIRHFATILARTVSRSFDDGVVSSTDVRVLTLDSDLGIKANLIQVRVL